MDFAFSDEQEELRRTVRAFLADTSPETEVRRLMETPEGFDRALWRRMGYGAGSPGAGRPRGVRRRRVRARRSGRGHGGDGTGTAVRALPVLGRAGDHHAVALRRRGRPQGTAAGPGLRRTRRDTGPDRGLGTLGRDGCAAHRPGKRRELAADRTQDVRSRRRHRRCRAHRGPYRRRHRRLPGGRRRGRADPGAAAHDGPDPPAGTPRLPGRTGDPAADARRRLGPGRAGAGPGRGGAGRRTGRAWPPGCSTWPWSTPRPGTSSGGPSVRSRR